MRLLQRLSLVAIILSGTIATTASAEGLMVKVTDAPDHGLLLARVDLTAAANFADLKTFNPTRLKAAVGDQAQPVAAQFIPAGDFDRRQNMKGLLALRLPGGGDHLVRLRLTGEPDAPLSDWDGTVETSAYRVTHSSDAMGGLPSQITFRDSGKTFDTFRFNDRVHHEDLGSFSLKNDPDPDIERLSTGPLCTAIRVRARYFRNNNRPDSQPRAAYHFLYFHDRPLVYVTASMSQAEPHRWGELHFLELNYPDRFFTHWAGGDSTKPRALSGNEQSHTVENWGALLKDQMAIGMLAAGRLRVYDGRGGYGTYLHAFGDRAWQGWDTTSKQFASWLWVGTAQSPAERIAQSMDRLPTQAKMRVTTERVRKAVAQIEEASSKPWWHEPAADRLEAEGRYQAVINLANGVTPQGWTSARAGDLGLLLRQEENRLEAVGLYDIAQEQSLMAKDNPPLFALDIRGTEDESQHRLTARSAWQDTSVNHK
jgi:hypothetical protein